MDFQYLFTAAVLLVALMIYNVRKMSAPTIYQVTQLVELLAELSLNQLPGYTSPSYNQGPFNLFLGNRGNKLGLHDP